MAKKKTTDELGVGARVRVKAGTSVPEMPDVSCGGWTAAVVETSGKKSNTQYVIEWDDATLAAMPETYLKTCERRGCFTAWLASKGACWSPRNSGLFPVDGFSTRFRRKKVGPAIGATTLECDVRLACFADEIPHCGCQFRSGGPLVPFLPAVPGQARAVNAELHEPGVLDFRDVNRAAVRSADA